MCTASQRLPSAGPESWTADRGRPSSPGATPASERAAPSGASAEAGAWHGSLLAPCVGVLTSQAPAAVAASDGQGVAPAPVTSRAPSPSPGVTREAPRPLGRALEVTGRARRLQVPICALRPPRLFSHLPPEPAILPRPLSARPQPVPEILHVAPCAPPPV